jgi:hypothetical protein
MTSEKKSVAIPHATRGQMIFFSWTKDILIYVTVLNLFVEYNPVKIIDSFTVSILTAVLLKVLLEIILTFEHKVSDVFKANKVLRIFFVWLILFSSKFLILEFVNIVFGEHVALGKFWDVFLLAFTLLLVRKVIYWIYQGLGKSEPQRKEASG